MRRLSVLPILLLLSLPSLSAQIQSQVTVSVTATRLSDQPLLSPAPGTFYSAGIFNPAAISQNDAVGLLFRAQDGTGTSRIGRATAGHDAMHFTIELAPALIPEEPYEVGGGVEDPRIVKIGTWWYLTYTGYNGHDAQLCLAYSHDGHHWTRKGVILPAYKGTWNQQWTKSGAIVPRKINNKWWMYYLGTRTLPGNEIADDKGGHTVDYMGLASSDDLIHWKDATPEPVLSRRPGSFDSRVMEPGPAPLVTPIGILLFYNGADQHLVYRTGWALFDLHDPAKLIARSDTPFLQPELPWEKSGQVPNVVFLEGLITPPAPPQVYKPGVHPPSPCDRDGVDMLGYYGAADKYIGGVTLHIALTGCPK
jgi:predicted GH43/DUF377 family glycosyl hydrolase